MKCLSVCILLIITSSLNAQVSVGLMGGINFSNANTRDFYFTDANSETKLSLGAALEYRINNNISFLFEPLYTEHGTNSEPNSFQNTIPKIYLSITYLELPVLFKYSVGELVQPYLFAGPSISVRLNSAIDAKVNYFTIGMDSKNILKPIEYSFHLGAGINYSIDDFVKTFIETKYVWGLNDIIKKGTVEIKTLGIRETIEIPDETKYFNKGFRVMMGFALPLDI